MKIASTVMLCAVGTLCCLCGCETVTIPPEPDGTQVVEPGDVVVGKPTDVTMYDLESASRQLISKMLANAEFKRNYNVAKKARGRLPIIIIGDIEARMPPGVRMKARLEIVRDGVVRTSLLNSGLFTIKSAGAESSPDYILIGDFREESDTGGFHSQYLRLAIQNIESGEIVWEEMQKVVKR